MTEREISKRILSEFLGFLRYKVDHDALTLEEEQAMLRLFERNIPVSATAEDLAGYYGKSEDAIHLVIHRKLLSKPKRRVLYSFREFQKIAPDKWKK